MTDPCEFCGEGDTEERGAPMYYDDRDIHAHIDCAIEHGVGQDS